MKENWLKDGLNDKLGDYGSPIDLEDAWKALEANRKPPKKKRKFLGWWFLGTILFISLGGYLFNDEYLSSMNTSLQSEKIEKVNIQNITPNKSSKNQNITFSKEQESYTSSIDKTIHLQSNKSIVKEERLESIHSKSPKSISPNNNTFTQNKYSPKQNSNTNPILFSEKEELIRPSEYKNSLSKSIARKISKTSDLSKSEVYLNLLPEQEKEFDFEIQTDKNKIIQKFPKLISPQFLGIESGYGFLSSGSIINEESNLDMVSVSLFYEKYFKQNFYLKTGLTFDQFTNQLTSSNVKSYTEPTENQIIVINYYQDGTIENIYGMSDVAVKEETNFNLFNKYRFISIPVIFGWQSPTFKRNSIQIEGGISTSIFGKYSGNIVTNDTNEILGKLSELDLKKAGILKATYALQWNYSLLKNQNWVIFTKVQGNQHLNNISTSENLNVEKFKSHQLLMGFKYQF